MAGLVAFFTTPRSAQAGRDFFSNTDFVGKTRSGPHEKFYINYFKPMRRMKEADWKLRVGGLCRSPQNFSLSELKNFSAVSQTSRLKCVECWSAKAQWTGFRFSELEHQVQPLPEATAVLFHCADTYIECLELKDLREERTLLVYGMDGARLSDEHGFPLRIIIPSKYGYKNPKAIVKIEFVAQVQYGTWSKLGPYSTDGTILPGYDHPLDRGGKKRRISGGEIFD